MGSWVWGIVLVLLALIGGIAISQTDQQKQMARSGYSATVVGNMMVYRNSVTAYAQSHSNEVGEVADESLSLPGWYNRIGEVRNYVDNGLGYVYYTSSSDGQAYDLLKQSDHDVLVGINQGGFLFNPNGGLTSIAIPGAIPDGALVFVPAALNAASPPAAPVGTDCAVAAFTSRTWMVGALTCQGRKLAGMTVTDGATLRFPDNQTPNSGDAYFRCTAGVLSSTEEPGATCTSVATNCSVAAGTSRSWTVGGASCAGATSSASTVTDGSTLSITSTNGNTGTAGFVCSSGSLSTTPDGSETCSAPAPSNCSVAAGTSRSWTVSGVTCAGATSSASTVPSGTSLSITSTNGNTGTAGFVCSSGSLSTTPDGSQTCTAAASPCVLPSPSTQTDTASQTATQTLGCATGYSGAITQTQPQEQTRTRTAYCPAPTGAYAWNPWTPWSAWSAAGPWTTTSDTCVANCVVPTPSTQTQTISCPVGQTGSITQTSTASCPSSTGSPVWSAWVTTSNTCVAAPANMCYRNTGNFYDVRGVLVGPQSASFYETHTYNPSKGIDRWNCQCRNGTTETVGGMVSISARFTGTQVQCSGTPNNTDSAQLVTWTNLAINRTWSSSVATCNFTGTITRNTQIGSYIIVQDTTPPGVGQAAYGVFLGSAPATEVMFAVNPLLAFDSGTYDGVESWCSP